MSVPITVQDFGEIRWRGHWIWVEPAAPGGMFPGMVPEGRRPEARGLFRKTFTLDRIPARAPARITADSRYLLFVNGQEAYRGPVRSQPRRLHYDLFDLAPYLRVGENAIAVYVVYYGFARSFWLPATPNMTLGKSGVLVFEANLGDAGWLVSDASWKAVKSDAWCEDWRSGGNDLAMISEGVPLEVFDARRLPYGWEQPGFDDRGWGNAHLIPAVHIGGFAHTQPPTDPYGPLYPRPIAKLGGEFRTPDSLRVEHLAGQVSPDIGDPVRRLEAALDLRSRGSNSVGGPAQGDRLPLTVDVPAGGSVRIVLDMGVIVMGQVQFEVQAPSGTLFDLSYTEDPLVRASAMLGMHAGTRYIARGDSDRFQVYDALGFRYAYVLIHGVAGKVTLQGFGVQEDVYPWQPGASFRCSDEELNRIFQAGIRTVQLNSRDAFTDCPTREQRAWVGDSVVHQMVHLATNLDWRLAWHYLTLGNSPRSDGILPMSVVGEIESSGAHTIPDWSLHWVHGVYNLYRFAGDGDAVKAFMPTVERILRWYAPFQTAGGVLQDVVEWDLVDWSSVSVKDTSAILTAIWARGLREFAEMAGWLEENASRRWAEGLYARAKTGFEVFWDEVRGSCVDHIVDGIRQPEMSQLAGALAIVSGLAPQERWGRIVQAITDPSSLVVRSWTGGGGEYQMQKMMKQFQGIYEIDWDAERQVVLAEPFMSYVVHDAVALAGQAERLPQLCRRWSEFLMGGYDTIGECWGWGTHVHGWSCTPTKDMVFYTLGVTPAEPGYTRARIAPCLGDLAWAEGQVPTPHGLIHVRAEPGRVTIDSPVPAIVELPGQAPQTLPAGHHEVKAH
jgi:hypothetical protein